VGTQNPRLQLSQAEIFRASLGHTVLFGTFGKDVVVITHACHLPSKDNVGALAKAWRQPTAAVRHLVLPSLCATCWTNIRFRDIFPWHNGIIAVPWCKDTTITITSSWS
jgi:hypothetical protein